jgi:hypothetical protein
MKFSYSVIVSLLLFVISTSQAWSNNTKTCLHMGKVIEPFDSVWVQDPVLARQFIEYYEERGLAKELIEQRLSRSDWTGFRFVCHPVVKYHEIKSPSAPAQGVTITGYVLTLNEYSLEYYLDIQKNMAAETAKQTQR